MNKLLCKIGLSICILFTSGLSYSNNIEFNNLQRYSDVELTDFELKELELNLKHYYIFKESMFTDTDKLLLEHCLINSKRIIANKTLGGVLVTVKHCLFISRNEPQEKKIVVISDIVEGHFFNYYTQHNEGYENFQTKDINLDLITNVLKNKALEESNSLESSIYNANILKIFKAYVQFKKQPKTKPKEKFIKSFLEGLFRQISGFMGPDTEETNESKTVGIIGVRG